MSLVDFSLKGKTILITGASSGLGRECAIQCSAAGANVILMARNLDRLKETSTLLSPDSSFSIIQVDFENEMLPENQIQDAVAKHGRINGVVHAAGISTTLPVRLLSAEKISRFFQVNVTSAIMLSKYLCKPSIMDPSGGSIIFFASVMGLVGEVGKTVYSLTKGALVAGSKSMALELAPKKIRVNCIAPGVVETPMTQEAVYNQTELSRNKIVDLHPLGIGSTNDISNACIYLLSDASRWVTGTTLVIDGGYTAR